MGIKRETLFGSLVILLIFLASCAPGQAPFAGKAVEAGAVADCSTISVVSQRVSIGDGASGTGARGRVRPPREYTFTIPAGMTCAGVEARVGDHDPNSAYVNSLTFNSNEANQFVIPPPRSRVGSTQVYSFTLGEPLGEGNHTLVIDAVNPGLGQGVDDFSVYYVKLKNE